MPRDERTYITLHDGMPEHPKVEELSDRAFRLLIETWCWCSRNRTDGLVKAASWSKRGTPAARRELIAAGLVEEAEDGVRVHDYLEHQRSAAEIDELKAKRAAAGRKGGTARSTRQANAQASASAKGKQAGSKAEAESETDTEEPPEADASGSPAAKPRTARGTRIPEDFTPTAELIAWAEAEAPHAGQRDHDEFMDHWRAAPGRQGVKADWPATWKNWMRRASDRRATSRPPGASPARGAPTRSTTDDRVAAAQALKAHYATPRPTEQLALGGPR